MNGKNGAIGLNVAKLVGEDSEFVGGPSSTTQKINLDMDLVKAIYLCSPVMTHCLQEFNLMRAIRITVQVHLSVNMAIDLTVIQKIIKVFY